MKKETKSIIGTVIFLGLITISTLIFSPERVFTLFYFVMLMIYGCIIYMCFLMFFQNVIPNIMAKRKSPTITTSAIVFSKAMSHSRFGSACFVSFTLPDGTRKNIRVNINQYNMIRENEEGVLSFKEYGEYILFIGFERHV